MWERRGRALREFGQVFEREIRLGICARQIALARERQIGDGRKCNHAHQRSPRGSGFTADSCGQSQGNVASSRVTREGHPPNSPLLEPAIRRSTSSTAAGKGCSAASRYHGTCHFTRGAGDRRIFRVKWTGYDKISQCTFNRRILHGQLFQRRGCQWRQKCRMHGGARATRMS
jgi:hypothetical protein